MTKICSIEGCGREVKRRGWCNKHYYRWYKTASGIPGVYQRKSNGKWRAILTVNGKHYYKEANNQEEAIKARRQMECEYLGQELI